MTAIHFLYGCTRSDGEVGTDFVQGADAFLQHAERAGDAPDLIVNLGWSVERNDYVIDIFADGTCVTGQKQTSGENTNPYSALSQNSAKAKEIGMHQRFTAGEYGPFDPQLFDTSHVAVQVFRGHFPSVSGFPDIAHHAAAVAAAVGTENQDRQPVQ
jgi:hypothetical protein